MPIGWLPHLTNFWIPQFVLQAQEVIFAYVAQAIVLHVIPYYLSFVGAALVVASAVGMPMEKYVTPKMPERLRVFC